MSDKRIAFYAPLKSAEHPVPSGDRLMARSLIRCLEESGYRVATASQLRARVSDPHDLSKTRQLLHDAKQEVARLTLEWEKQGAPDCWFCYHPYYKSPDLIGPELCKAFQVPYVTAEASFSSRRTDGFWAAAQEAVLDAVSLAKVNLYFTERDKKGLLEGCRTAELVKLPPFIEPLPSVPFNFDSENCNLVTVAMMRPGDKYNSYRYLAQSLAAMQSIPWVLNIVGDGPAEADVHALFEALPAERIIWHGKKGREQIASLLTKGALYVWPGCGEAYGLAYLEAQSVGLPVVAFETAGVPEVVAHGYSGILVEENNVSALSNAITHLLSNSDDRLRHSKNAVQHVNNHHTFEKAHRALGQIMAKAIGNTRE